MPTHAGASFLNNFHRQIYYIRYDPFRVSRLRQVGFSSIHHIEWKMLHFNYRIDITRCRIRYNRVTRYHKRYHLYRLCIGIFNDVYLFF